MMKKHLTTLLLIVLAGLWMAGPAAAGSDTLTQVGTIDALFGGLYDGTTTTGSLKSLGDLGVGTFDALDGEMVVLDGKVYRVRSDGRAVVVPDGETTPFAAVTFFHADKTLAIPAGTDVAAFHSLASGSVPSPNFFYAFRLEGRFTTIRTRSVPKQHKPYLPLAQVVKQQSVFNFKDVKGVVVGFYCPPFVKGINVPGYHLHFLTADRSAGGHVLAFKVDKATLQIETLRRFDLRLPQSKAFERVDLRRDRKKELDKVEK